MVTKDEILTLIDINKRLKKICVIRGVVKLNALGEGFGEFNAFESISYDGGEINITYYDRGYDLHETCDVTLTYDEIAMTYEEFEYYLNFVKLETYTKKVDKEAKIEQDAKIKRELEFNKLKKEFG